MKVLTYPNGPLEVNTYLVQCGAEAVVVDPGSGLEQLLKYLQESELTVSMILLTHGHLDHVAGIATVKQHYPGALVYIHEKDKEMACSLDTQSQILMMERPQDFEIDYCVEDGQKIAFCNSEFEVIYIGGHSAGSVCYKIDNELFTGDTLFNFAIGRTDLMGSTTHRELLTNIQQRLLLKFAGDVKVYPGHGPSTSIGFEKSNNVMAKI